MSRRSTRAASLVIVAWLGTPAVAESLALLAPPPVDDARRVLAIGPAGEIYAPDGQGAWVRSLSVTTADTLTVAGRAGGDVVAGGDGTVYKLAPNGWSAIRLHQKDKATMAGGPRAVAAVKRQIYALDRTKAGEPEKLALAPAPVLAIGAGKTIVIATERGLARVDGKKVTPIAGAPRQVQRLVDDHWAIVATGAYDLRAMKTIVWPAGAKLQVAAGGPDGTLVAVLAIGGKLELATVAKGKLTREPIEVPAGGMAVGLVVDRALRVAIALADGRIAIRDRSAWSTTHVTTSIPPARPGPPPARSP